MRLMETAHASVEHKMFEDDDMREHEGLLQEIAPPSKVGATLEDRMISPHAKIEEEEMQMLVTGGSV